MTELWVEIWQTIRRNKWRSIMTAFGVFWGLLMLILLVGFGEGIFGGIVGSLSSIPSNSMFFGGDHTSMTYKGFGINRTIQTDNDDLVLLKEDLAKQMEYLTPLNFVRGNEATYQDQKYSATMVGTYGSYYHVIPQQVLYGRYINDIDLHEHRKVCVLGLEVYETLFPAGGDPCGKLIKTGGIYYTVVGVVKKLSGMINLGADIDRSILLPLTTAQLTYNQGDHIDLIVVTLKEKYPISEWEDRILSKPKEHHFVHPDDKTAFWSFNLQEIFDSFKMLFLGINILLWIVGCGSLLAGLIGISNIMLVTVKERTQEIGVRRALGAKPFTILSQILAESLVLTSAAGISGLMLGIWILHIADSILKANPAPDGEFSMSNPHISFSVAIAAFFVIVLGGLLAGWMPAHRAMKIKAIDALREE
mgnify:CR=1 FL=1